MSDRLLTVDLRAALRKVSLGRLRGEHQVPLALARAAVRGGSRGLTLRLGRGRLEIASRGEPVGADAFSTLAVLLDEGRDDLDRQRALESLEADGLLDLLVAFATPARMVVMQGGPAVAARLVVQAGRVRLDQQAGRSFNLVLSGLSGPWARWREELAARLRFAPYPVELDGRRVDEDLRLDDSLIEHSFRAAGVKGLVGLPRRGLAARTRLIVDGVLLDEVWDSPSSGAVWDAVVHCPADSLARTLARVEREAEALLGRAGETLDRLGPGDRARLTQLLFRLADHGRGAAALGQAALFRTVSGQRMSCDALRAAALGRILRAVSPAADPARYEIAGTVFVLDESERSFIENHLDLLVREPRPKPRPRARWASRLAGFGRRLRRGLLGALRRLFAAAEVPPGQLDDAERALLHALGRAAGAGLLAGRREVQALFIRSGWIAWRFETVVDGPDRLLLGRRHRQVRRLIQAFGRDPTGLYPVLMLLADGQDAFGDRRPEALRQLVGIDAGPNTD